MKKTLASIIALGLIAAPMVPSVDAAVYTEAQKNEVLENFESQKILFTHLEHNKQEQIIKKLEAVLTQFSDSKDPKVQAVIKNLNFILNDYKKHTLENTQISQETASEVQKTLNLLDTLIAKKIDKLEKNTNIQEFINKNMKYTLKGNSELHAKAKITKDGKTTNESLLLKLTDIELIQNIFDSDAKANIDIDIHSDMLGGDISAQAAINMIQNLSNQYIKYSGLKIETNVSKEFAPMIEKIKESLKKTPENTYFALNNNNASLDIDPNKLIKNIDIAFLASTTKKALTTSNLKAIAQKGDTVYLTPTIDTCKHLYEITSIIKKLAPDMDIQDTSCSLEVLKKMKEYLKHITLTKKGKLHILNIESTENHSLILTFDDTDILSFEIKEFDEEAKEIFSLVGTQQNMLLKVNTPEVQGELSTYSTKGKWVFKIFDNINISGEYTKDEDGNISLNTDTKLDNQQILTLQ